MKLCPKCQKHFSDDANFCPVDAARLLPLDAAQAGGADTLAARFDVGAKIGGGRTGAVYAATDKQGGAAVVIKLVAPEVMALPGVAARLDRELKQLERVSSSGVAKLIASGKRDDQPWLALEPIQGAHTLADAITARGPIDAAGAAALIEVIGEALIEAAQVGVVHRDLAPKNILFAGDQVKLINFSLPVPTGEKSPGVSEFIAPEQNDGKPVDQRSNLFSLGALYYYVLTGEPPASGEALKPPSQLAPVPSSVEALIVRALDKSPTKRFLTVRQFVDEVGRVARGEPDVKMTQPLGKAGSRKADLVQTLLGVRSGSSFVTPTGSTTPIGHPEPSAPVSAPVAAPAPTPAVAPAFSTPASTASIASAPTVDTPALTGRGLSQMIPLVAPPRPKPEAIADDALTIPVQKVAASDVTKDAVVEPAVIVTASVPVEVPPPVAAVPEVAAPVVAAPVVAAPVVAAPVVAAPVVAAAAAKKKNAPADGDGGGAKGKFRETMWFKKGEMDSAAAADEREKTGKDAATDKADSMPIDERYKDDGSISRGDKQKYSLRTGDTQMMKAMKDDPATSGVDRVTEDALIGEMKGGRGKVLALIGAGVLVIVVIIAMLVH